MRKFLYTLILSMVLTATPTQAQEEGIDAPAGIIQGGAPTASAPVPVTRRSRTPTTTGGVGATTTGTTTEAPTFEGFATTGPVIGDEDLSTPTADATATNEPAFGRFPVTDTDLSTNPAFGRTPPVDTISDAGRDGTLPLGARQAASTTPSSPSAAATTAPVPDIQGNNGEAGPGPTFYDPGFGRTPAVDTTSATEDRDAILIRADE